MQSVLKLAQETGTEAQEAGTKERGLATPSLSGVTTPWGPTGYLVYKRTYARKLDSSDVNSPVEEFPDTVERVISATRSQLGINWSEAEELDLRNLFLGLKCSVAGRFLWQLGTQTVDKLGLLSLQNCAACVINEPVKPFTWAMDALMLGCGVGYNIQREYVYELPKPKEARVIRQDDASADFIVPDSREGWVSLLRRTLEAHFFTGNSFTYSTQLVRGKGTPIKGFGGTASGPEELCWGITKISEVLNARAGKKVRPIDCLDIMNIIGYVVVAGNVRRSAQIAIGDYDDIQFLQAKRWDLGNIPNWRAMSNNSVVCSDVSQLPTEFWDGYRGKGEPYGLINLKLSRAIGRTGDNRYPDPDVVAYNPCAEQSLANYETCCLAEIFLPNIESKEELIRVATHLYRINKHSLALGSHQSRTAKVVNEHMRMGIGITGVLQASGEQLSWLSDCYEELRAFDVTYSIKHRWPHSIKLTTVKPSGTLSLLAGVTPGAHPGYSQYFIRRIRIAFDSPLLEVCRANGYHVEPQKNFDGTDDHNTMVVSFPSSYPAGTVVAKDTTAISQLETIKWLQANWSDNAVSVTIYYKMEELPEIQEWLANNYSTNVKTVSFLLHQDHGFAQAPYEEITKEEFDLMSALVIPITSLVSQETEIDSSGECVSGACPIR